MNIHHNNYIIYKQILDDMYDETHIFGRKFTDYEFFRSLKHYNIYEWYISEKLKDERKDKLNKINENI